ncbi:CRE-ECH-8 protein [Caenorhabditis remanei]|uniref:CRE-ECH-8 protein n=1 Tax=Caenorhabditis remanei TaxID=31234 RepID=E3MM59_CAERE|nr:CRE-ECH-8 protein [Caenorhabditis remanei]
MDKMPEDIRNYLMEAHQLAGQWSLPNNRGNHTNSKSIPLKSVSVIGGGTMGRGIAMAFSLAGFETILVELNQQAVENCRKELEITYAREKTFKRLNDSKIEKLRNTLQITTDFQKLKNCDLVSYLEEFSMKNIRIQIVEAVFEDMKLKKELFTKLDKICKSSCIFGTNTSSLDLNEMSSVLSDRTKVVGIHFFNPANLIRMVEVIYGSYTSSEAVATAFEACRAIKKLPVLVGNCPAFVFNRLLGVYLNQSQKLMYEYGYLPHQVDKIITNFGFLMGPLTVADMNGLDVMEKLKKENGWPASDFEKEVWRQKRYGRKTNKGYYKYDPKTHKKEVDMEMEQLIEKFSKQARPNIQILNDQDAVNFLLYPMFNEGLLCIEEGIIDHENLIDIMFILGFGWPILTGGPMMFGHQQGIEKVANTLILWSSLEPTNRIYKVAEKLRQIDQKHLSSKL